jgi:hypothetical protein
LEPEFIWPQDGSEKEDCEQNAIKRWRPVGSRRNHQRFAPYTLTILADDFIECSALSYLFYFETSHKIYRIKNSDVNIPNRIIKKDMSSIDSKYQFNKLSQKDSALSYFNFSLDFKTP